MKSNTVLLYCYGYVSTQMCQSPSAESLGRMETLRCSTELSAPTRPTSPFFPLSRRGQTAVIFDTLKVASSSVRVKVQHRSMCWWWTTIFQRQMSQCLSPCPESSFSDQHRVDHVCIATKIFFWTTLIIQCTCINTTIALKWICIDKHENILICFTKTDVPV